MHKRFHMAVLLSISMCGLGSVARAATPICPGQNNPSMPTNLACEIVDATHASYQGSTQAINQAIASQFGQLPLATAVSGSGLVFNRQLGVFTASEGSLGTILTQRAETIGKHKLMLSFAYQHFSFGHVDGIGLNEFPTIAPFNGGYFQSTSDVNLSIDQYAGLAVFGLTNRIDVAVMVPFSHVNMSTRSLRTFWPTQVQSSVDLPGSANGVGDVTLNVKANVLKGQHTSMALGSEVRFPSGDAGNFLGSGAYGVKPYVILTHHGRFTTSLNLGYQWNSSSILNQDANGNPQDLPSSFLYSGAMDTRLTRKITFVTEFLGQCVINGARLAEAHTTSTTFTGVVPAGYAYVKSYNATYAMDSLGPGLKVNPFKHLYLNGTVMFSLDSAGLRSTITPLAGASYEF